MSKPPAAHAHNSSDITASLVLVAATIFALIFANTALAPLYKSVLGTPLTVGLGDFVITDSVKSWIKNALMAVFFLAVGLEIKAEFAEGSLSDRRRATLPFVAAAGGMAVPAAVYLAIAGSAPELRAGWAIPSATDIAFAVGVVGFIGRHVSPALKAFLLAVAVIDDLGAILIIAAFYTGGISLAALAVALAFVVAMWALNFAHVTRIWAYLVLGVGLWIATYHSGINPTLAGVVTALFVPLHGSGHGTGRALPSPLHALEHALKPAVAFLIMPVFAFANAGVALAGLGLADLAKPVTAGVALGLAAGKPIGITLAVWAAVSLGIASLPKGATWRQIMGIGALAGIGFTMSLFIGVLAFGEGAMMDQVRLGVLIGSLAATLVGVLLLVQRQPVGKR